MPDLPGAASDPRRGLRDLRRQERVCGRGSAVPSRSQHSDGLEECQPTQRDDATAAPRRRLGLATIVPFDAGQPANGTPTRVPVACGLLLAWQLTTHRPAELLAGDRGGFRQSRWRGEADGVGVRVRWREEGAGDGSPYPISSCVWVFVFASHSLGLFD